MSVLKNVLKPVYSRVKHDHHEKSVCINLKKKSIFWQ